MSNDALKRQITATIDEINAAERSLPVIDGFEDYDRMEALDIINRIERKILANMPATEPAQ